MRTIHTFLLRLMVDTDDPQALRGSIQAIGEDSSHPFTDASSLLARLRELTSITARRPSDPTDE